MCGIAGVSARWATLKSMLITLGQLERGREGAGIGWVDYHGLHVLKAPVHPVFFCNNAKWVFDAYSSAAVSHNRLPSIGKPTMENTHPFRDCQNRFVLIHNGHIASNGEREHLKKLGHNIRGETDSEMLTHMLCQSLNEGKDMLTAIREIARERPATILVLTRAGVIYGMSDGWHPLNVAEAADGVYMGSTLGAVRNVCPHMRKLRILKRGEVVEVKNGRAVYYPSEIKEKPIIHYGAYSPEWDSDWWWNYYKRGENRNGRQRHLFES